MPQKAEARGLTIYEIDNAYRSVALDLERLDLLDPRDYDGDAPVEEYIEQERQKLIMRIGAIDDLADIKVEALAGMTQELFVEAEAIKAEEQRLQKRRKAVEGRAEWMKSQIYKLLAERPEDEQKVKTATMTIALQKSPASIQVADELEVDEEWKERVVVTKVDKNAAKKAWREATDKGAKPLSDEDAARFKGFRFITDSKHVRIR